MATSAPTSGWSSALSTPAWAPGYTYTATPAAGGSVVLQWSADNVNWQTLSNAPFSVASSGQLPQSALYIRGMSFGVAGTFDATANGSVGALTPAQAAAVGMAVDTYGFPDAFRASDGYFLRFVAPFAPATGDLKAWDRTANRNDGTFQANLSAAAAWATAGLLTQKNPDTVSEQTLVSFPALGFDYTNGECILIFWKGRGTPEGTDQPMLGNTIGASIANGIRIPVTSAGKIKFAAYQNSGAVSASTGATTSTAVETSLTHSFAICLCGSAGPNNAANKIKFWIDGVADAGTANFVNFNGGTTVDCNQGSRNLLLGGDGNTSASIQLGLALQTEALQILKGRLTSGAPAAIDTLVKDLHSNPAKIVTAAEW